MVEEGQTLNVDPLRLQVNFKILLAQQEDLRFQLAEIRGLLLQIGMPPAEVEELEKSASKYHVIPTPG